MWNILFRLVLNKKITCILYEPSDFGKIITFCRFCKVYVNFWFQLYSEVKKTTLDHARNLDYLLFYIKLNIIIII